MPSARDRFWARVHRRALDLTPAQAAAFLAAVDALADDVGRRDVEALIAAGDIEGVIRVALSDENVGRAFVRYRARIQLTTRDAVGYFAKDIPGVSRGTIAFDILSPKVVQAVQQLDSTMMQKLTADIRETARLTIRQGLEQGAGPRTTARALREVIGLAPNQIEAVENFRRSLEGVEGAGSPLTRALRDRRFDPTIRKGNLTSDQIEKMTAAYRRRFVKWNAETNARTATLDSLKLGQRLAWEDAIDKGIVPAGALMKAWKGVMDDREREEHREMEGETVPFDQPYSNGEMIPGESTFNCRCLSVMFVATAKQQETLRMAESQREVQQYSARRAPTEAIGASPNLTEPGWATATDPDEIARRAAMTREVVADVTKTLGYRGEIEVVERASATVRSRLGKEFTVMGEYNPGSKGIRLFAENIPSAAEARGVLVHEITHAQFDARIVGKRENFEWMRRNVPALEREDGVSPYSTAFWRRAERVRDFMEQREAINETLAEWARLRAAGATPTGRPTYQSLYDRMFPSGGKKK